MSKCIILDTETTNLPPLGEACEIAYFELASNLPTMSHFEEDTYGTNFFYKTEADNLIIGKTKLIGKFHQTFMPKGEFSPRASEVNGFTKEKLKGSPCISTFKFPEDVTYLIGHNVMFDWQMVTKPDVKLICTKELASRYLTQRRGKGLNTLTGLIERYYPEEAKELIANAHSALHDCKLCYLILLKVLEARPDLDSFDKLAECCTQPKILEKKIPSLIQAYGTSLHTFRFGKYKGLALEEMIKTDRNYFIWIVEKSTMPQDLKDFIKQFLIDNN